MSKQLPLLFLHGSAETYRCWDGVLDHTEPKGEVFRSNNLVTVERILGAAEDLPSGCHVIAHSYGGVLGLILALHHPEKVAKLTLIEPVPFLLLRGRDDAALEGPLAVYEAFKDFDPAHADEGVSALLNYWLGDGAWDRTPPPLRQLLLHDADLIHNHIGHAATWEPPIDRLAALPMPVSIIAGSDTRESAASIARILSGLIPNSDYHVVQGAGHDLVRTHPREIAELVDL